MNQADQVIETVQKISVKLSSTGDYDKQIEETNEMEAGIYPNETTTHTYNEIFTETVEQNTVSRIITNNILDRENLICRAMQLIEYLCSSVFLKV